MKVRFLFLMGVLFLLSGCEAYYPDQRARAYRMSAKPVPQPVPLGEYVHQAAAVRRHGLRVKRLLNKSEEQVFWQLVAVARKYQCRVFAQVSLGEIYAYNNMESFQFINCKRTDFCLTDKDFQPIAVIEYQGAGHGDVTSRGRDMLKKEAALTAGLRFIEINRGEEDLVEEKVAHAMGWNHTNR